MVPEAPLEDTGHGLVPQGEGWFVVNAGEALWQEGTFGAYTRFEGEGRFPRLGINLSVLPPGTAACMYHGEDEQEDFLVLAGECLLLVEGEERRLRAWDFVHCPGGTAHIFVGAGDGPCAIFMIGGRAHPGSAQYLRDEAALRHGAGPEADTTQSKEAYARFPPWRLGQPEGAWPL